jgi:hypothetical protein
MCTVLLPPGGYTIAVNKYIVSYQIISYIILLMKNLRNCKYMKEKDTLEGLDINGRKIIKY